MSDRDATIVVDIHDALPEVLDRLRFAAGRPALLDVPHGSSLLLTAIEFRALGDTAGRHGVTLTIRTDDPLRLQLASMFSLATVTPDTSSPPVATSTVAPPTSPEASEGRPKFLDKLGMTRSSPVAPNSTTRDASNLASATSPVETKSEDQDHPLERIKSKLPGRESLPPLSRRAIVVIASALIGLLLLAIAATVLVLPRATVAVSLMRQPVSAELIYAVAVEGAPARSGAGLTIPAKTVSFEIAFDHSIPATATRVVPNTPASGAVVLVNPSTEEVTIEAGTEISVDETMSYEFAETVTVPAGAPFENRYGQAEATVRAEEPGSAGNLDTGVLTGQLDSGVYFSNRNAPITGGTDRTVPMVSAADLEALRTKANEELPRLADEAFLSQLPPGDQVIPPSRTHGESTYTYDHAEGDDAEFVSIHAVMPVSALAFNPADALAQATAAIAERLAGQAPGGFELDRPSVVLGDPSLVAEQHDGAQFRITAKGELRAIFTEDDRKSLARELAGKQPGGAETILQGDPRIEQFRVTYSPGWLPDRMPTSSGRIDVEISA